MTTESHKFKSQAEFKELPELQGGPEKLLMKQ